MKKYINLGLILFSILFLNACKKENSDAVFPTSLKTTDLNSDQGGGSTHRSDKVCLGQLTNYLFMFTNGSNDANWQGATKGFVGDAAVNGIDAKERNSGGVPYGGNIFTNDNSLGQWQNIINQNAAQSVGNFNEIDRINMLTINLNIAFAQINSLSPTLGYESVSSTSLDGLNTQDGLSQVVVINITSGLQVSAKIDITGDAGDVFILRWDADGDPSNGYQGITKFQSGGAIVPHGGLIATNFINVAGDISSSGGGSNPPEPYPQGPRYNNGTGNLITNGNDFNGGGFFTGYWLTTGDPVTGKTHSLSNAIFVGGWYTTSNQFSMTSGTSGVYVAPPAAVLCGS